MANLQMQELLISLILNVRPGFQINIKLLKIPAFIDLFITIPVNFYVLNILIGFKKTYYIFGKLNYILSHIFSYFVMELFLQSNLAFFSKNL